MLKLINNFIAQAICTASAEAVATAAKAGLSITQAARGHLRRRRQLRACSRWSSARCSRAATSTGLKFTLSNAAKDLRYYTHFTESLMLPSIIGEAVHQSLVTANALGFGDKYVPSLIEAQEKIDRA